MLVKTRKLVEGQWVNDDPVPTLEIVKRTCMSDFEQQPGDIQDQQLWIVENLFVKMMGIHSFGKNIRTTRVISDCVLKDDGKTPVFNASNRAWIYMVCENNWEKWEARGKVKKDRAEPPPKPTKQEMKDNTADPAAKAYHFAKYSVNDNGQAKEGGWTNAGKRKFFEVLADIGTYLQENKEQVAANERMMLGLLQAHNNVDANAGGAAAQAAGGEVSADEEDGLFDDISDDEDDDE